MRLDLPPIIGHRGATAFAPENTLASFALAAELGCRMVEFDVRLSGDGVPVVFHDDTLERCTAGRGRVGAMSLSHLQRLGIPNLDQVLHLCAARGMAVNIEIKPDAGTERATTLAALQVARALCPTPPLISSFSEAALAAAAEAAPDWPRGLLVERVPADWCARAQALGCMAIHAHHRALSVRLVHAMKNAEFAVLAYTVNRRSRAETLWHWGVDAIFTDRPGQLR